MATRTKRIGLREYARRRGCSPSSVSRAIAERRLVESVRRDSKGHPRINAELADLEWEANTDKGRRPVATSRKNPGQAKDGEGALDQPEGGADEGEFPSFEASRAKREAYAAKLKKLEYQEAAGQLVRQKDVRDELFKMARMVRNSILAVPARIAPILAHSSNQHEVHEIMTRELTQALTALADSMKEPDPESN